MKRFFVKTLAIILIITVLPLTAYANADIYYNELVGSIAKIDRYDEYARTNYLGDGPTWAKCRDGEIGNFKFWIDYWMSHYGYLDEYFDKTANIAKAFYKSKYLPKNIGPHYTKFITDFMKHAHSKMGTDSYIQFMTDSFPNNQKFVVSDMISNYIKNATDNPPKFIADNISTPLNLLWNTFVKTGYKPDSILQTPVNFVLSQGAKSLLSSLIYNSTSQSQFDALLGGDGKELCDKFASALVSGGLGYIDFFMTIPEKSFERINEIENLVQDNYTAEMKALDAHKTNIAINYIMPSVMSPSFQASYAGVSEEEYIGITTEVVEELTKSIDAVLTAKTIDEVNKVLETYYTILEDTITVERTQPIVLSQDGTEFFPEPEQNICIMQGDTIVTELFNITQNGVFGTSITPTKSVSNGTPYTIIQTKQFHHTVSTIQYPKGTNSALTKIQVKLTDNSTKYLTFTNFETEIAGLSSVIKAWPEDSTASYKIVYDDFGNAQIHVTAENGLNSSVYVVKNINSVKSNGEEVYSAKVIKTSGHTIAVSCENIPEENEDNLFAAVYTADNRMSQLIPYSTEAFSRIPYPSGGCVKLIYMDTNSLLPYAEAFCIN